MKFLFTILIFIPFGLLAQQKNPKSRTEIVYEVDKKTKKEVAHKESYLLYNYNGDVIEEFGYDKKGVVNKHIKYEYNSNGKKIKEIHLNEKNVVKKIVEIKYDASGNKIEEIEYKADNKTITSRKKFSYEY
jgi:hypothetical protein